MCEYSRALCSCSYIFIHIYFTEQRDQDDTHTHSQHKSRLGGFGLVRVCVFVSDELLDCSGTAMMTIGVTETANLDYIYSLALPAKHLFFLPPSLIVYGGKNGTARQTKVGWVVSLSHSRRRSSNTKHTQSTVSSHSESARSSTANTERAPTYVFASPRDLSGAVLLNHNVSSSGRSDPVFYRYFQCRARVNTASKTLFQSEAKRFCCSSDDSDGHFENPFVRRCSVGSARLEAYANVDVRAVRESAMANGDDSGLLGCLVLIVGGGGARDALSRAAAALHDRNARARSLCFHMENA